MTRADGRASALAPDGLYADLLIIDDMLPNAFSPFRTIEYAHYLDFFHAALLSLEGWHLGYDNRTFEEHLAALPIDPALKERILPFELGAQISARLAYVTFAGNAFRLLPYLEARSIPFLLQLYPGGAFAIDEPGSDAKLRRVLSSPLCRKVIVTQKLSRDYIQEKLDCDPRKVEFIYGGVFETRNGFDFQRDKLFYPGDKQTLDICFVAHRYSSNVTAKGYDNFVAIARELARTDPRLRFHVVGDYRPEDIPLDDVEARVTFYGKQPSSFFREFYPRMDAIISVNRPFDQARGVFGGFPTGACMEAAFRGVLNCINDPLGQNHVFTDQQDILLLDFDRSRSVARIRELLADPVRLYELAYRSWRKYREVFDADRQLWARTRLIATELLHGQSLVAPPAAPASLLDALPYAIAAVPYERQLREMRGALDAASLETANMRRQAGELRGQLQAVLTSTSWRMTKPLRAALSPAPRTARLLRRVLKLLWWSATGQLPRRLGEWRRQRNLSVSPPLPRRAEIPSPQADDPAGPKS